jgi:hypothetical protein
VPVHPEQEAYQRTGMGGWEKQTWDAPDREHRCDVFNNEAATFYNRKCKPILVDF